MWGKFGKLQQDVTGAGKGVCGRKREKDHKSYLIRTTEQYGFTVWIFNVRIVFKNNVACLCKC